MNVLKELVFDFFRTIKYFIESNLRMFASLLNIMLPYIMYFIGQYIFNNRKEFAVGSEILIPLLFCIVIYFIRSYANKIGKGITIPVPNKRFTEVDDNDEVSIEHSRIQELILYTADLEDWLERKGLL